MIRSPVTPTADEWNSHMVTHVPFRDWCPHCVRGRGNNDHHRRAQGREADDGRIVVSMDYGFLGSTGQGSSSTATMLVLKVKSTGMLTAMIVPKKGAENSWVQKRCARWIDNQGHGRINLRTDGEPAIVDLAKNVRRQREEGTETVLEHPPVGESQENGVIENGVRTAEGMVRTLKCSLEARAGIDIEPENDILKWLVEWAAYVHSRFCVGKDGRTPFERWRGRKCKRPVCEFGETVLFMPLKGARGGKLDPKFEYGVFLGVIPETGETLVGTAQGVIKTRTLRRLQERNRWQPERIKAVKGTPWAPAGDGAEQPVSIKVWVPQQEQSDPVKEPQFVIAPRRTYMRKTDFMKYGMTDGCKGCDMIRRGRPTQGHSEACRSRMETAMNEDDQDAIRVKRARDRIFDAAAEMAGRTLEAEPGAGGGGECADSAMPQCADSAMPPATETAEPRIADAGASSSSSSGKPAPAPVPCEVTQGPSDQDQDEEMEPDGQDRETKRQRLMELSDQTPEDMEPQIGSVLDLTTLNENKEPWDFSLEKDRNAVRNLVAKLQPKMVIGSPACTAFSALQRMNKAKIGEKLYNEMLWKAREHLSFCCQVYADQVQRGGYFLHMHPLSAISWKEDCVKRTLALPGVRSYVLDMCAYGLTQQDKLGEAAVKKPTRVITNAAKVGDELRRRCPGNHRHIGLVAGRATAAQACSTGLSRAISRGLAKQFDEDHLGMEMNRTAAQRATKERIGALCKTVGENDAEVCELSALTHEDPIRWQSTAYWDDAKGGWLDPELVAKARAEEMEYIHKHKVYIKVSKEECIRNTGKPPIKTRWVDTNKGSQEEPNVRSRWVAQDFRREARPDLYAATPPLEAMKAVISAAATGKKGEKILKVLDVRRAYFYAPTRRRVYVELPEEDLGPGDESRCGLLRVSLYGTRDAALNWEEELGKQMIQLGFERGRANPCLYVHQQRNIVAGVHGDDILGIGTPEAMEWMEKAMRRIYEMRTQTLGPGAKYSKVVTILNRKVRWGSDGLELEADPRHVADVLEALGLERANLAATPAVSEKTRAEDSREAEDVELDSTEATRYRSVVAKLNYLAHDRPDLKFSTMLASVNMSKPRLSDMRKLVRIGRFLRGRPRAVCLYRWQPLPSKISVYSDSDWAGCRVSRKSVSAGAIFVGDHCVKSWAKRQQVVALSTAEAELYAAVRAAADALGMQSLCRDIGIQAEVDLYLDSSSALALTNRAGLGRAKHVEVQNLWLQDAVRAGRLKTHKVWGEVNPADLGTKALDRPRINAMMTLLGYRYE